MKWLVAVLAVCIHVTITCSASDPKAWCYSQAGCNDTTWSSLFPQHCNGSRQSPINIVTISAETNTNLTAFNFDNFSNASALKTIQNTGRTIKVVFNSGVKISGGDLPETYDSLQFHLHWGSGSSVPGSEHTVNGYRYPMELHIVNMKSSYNGNTTQGIADSEGLAALGFFIEVMEGNTTGQPASWKTLTSYLANITDSGQSAEMAPGLTLDALLDGVNREKYYRYHGSLTTPTCNEAVIWTVFKEPIKVSKDLIDLFSTTVYSTNSTSSSYMTNVFRAIQPDQPVSTQASGSSRSSISYSLGLMALIFALWKS